jgi:hypothetical protein
LLTNLLNSQSLIEIGSGEEGDIQIATVLSVGIDTLKESFTQLWTDQQRLKDLIKGLAALKDNLTAIETLFSALNSAHAGVIYDAKSLLSTWSDVQTRLREVEIVDRKVTDNELRQIVAEWTQAQEAAMAYLSAARAVGLPGL